MSLNPVPVSPAVERPPSNVSINAGVVTKALCLHKSDSGLNSGKARCRNDLLPLQPNDHRKAASGISSSNLQEQGRHTDRSHSPKMPPGAPQQERRLFIVGKEISSPKALGILFEECLHSPALCR